MFLATFCHSLAHFLPVFLIPDHSGTVEGTILPDPAHTLVHEFVNAPQRYIRVTTDSRSHVVA
jgi:hypothetical protein